MLPQFVYFIIQNFNQEPIPPIEPNFLLQENNFFILQENGSKIIL